MTIKSDQVGYLGNAIDPKHRDLYGRFQGPVRMPGEEFESSAIERTNALAWAVQYPHPETPQEVIERAEAYLRYLSEGITSPSKAQ